MIWRITFTICVLLVQITPGYATVQVYWTGDRKIQRVDEDGSNLFDVIRDENPLRIALDLDGGKVYWTEHGQQRIRRANLDGIRNVEEIMMTGENLRPSGIALDTARKKMYWTEFSTGETFPPSAIRRANYDGSEIETISDIPKAIER